MIWLLVVQNRGLDASEAVDVVVGSCLNSIGKPIETLLLSRDNSAPSERETSAALERTGGGALVVTGSCLLARPCRCRYGLLTCRGRWRRICIFMLLADSHYPRRSLEYYLLNEHVFPSRGVAVRTRVTSPQITAAVWSPRNASK